MEGKTKFNLKIFLYYLIAEPFTDKVSIPNIRTILWAVAIISFFFRLALLFFISLFFELVLYVFYEYRSGKYMHWYRQRKYPEMREALKKVREERKSEEDKNI